MLSFCFFLVFLSVMHSIYSSNIVCVFSTTCYNLWIIVYKGCFVLLQRCNHYPRRFRRMQAKQTLLRDVNAYAEFLFQVQDAFNLMPAQCQYMKNKISWSLFLFLSHMCVCVLFLIFLFWYLFTWYGVSNWAITGAYWLSQRAPLTLRLSPVWFFIFLLLRLLASFIHSEC